MVGRVRSETVTEKVHAVESRNELVAEHETVFLPRGNVDPDDGVQEFVKVIPGSSLTVAP